MNGIKLFLYLMKEAGAVWYHRGSDYMASAVSYFALFAIAPLVFFSVLVVSTLYGEDLVLSAMLSWGSGMGTGVVTLIQDAVGNLSESQAYSLYSVWGSILFFGVIIMFFNTLADGLHRVWEVQPSGVSGLIKKSIHAIISLTLLQGFVIALIAAEFFFAIMFGGVPWSNLALSGLYIFALTILIALLYTILPLSYIPSLPARFYGALIAALCFVLGKASVSLHIAIAPVPDLFGAAGMAIIFLLWVYVTASFFYFGAAFAYVYDKHYGLLPPRDTV